MSAYVQLLSRATLRGFDPEPFTAGRSRGPDLWCEWHGGDDVAWVIVHGSLDDTTAHWLADAMHSVQHASLCVVDLHDARLGSGPTATTAAVLGSPRVVLKDAPPDVIGLLDARAELRRAG
jgi:hypothetical protein